MSNPQTIWNLSLALGCCVGAWWMKCSGVSDDDKNAGSQNGSLRGVSMDGVLRVLPDRGATRGSDPMKDADEHRGQIIDFRPAADRILMRRWAVANGFDRVRG